MREQEASAGLCARCGRHPRKSDAAAPAVLVRADVMAAQLSLSRSAFYELVRRGVIPSVLIGNIRRFDPPKVLATVRGDGR